ncbi:LytTR family transcriptional regulator DNA-binding domain-containing protein [Paenibacillus solisilvae]|uniref:LytTR family transcriptional regulator DNA-binding domain-containing protein n=1 Tax=Paenibacillus solisilvae TaxID=2486751 RepID=A0ABW0W867_9BACL
MSHWPVTRDKEGITGIIFIEFEKILKFTTQSNRVMVHTSDEVYYQLDNLDRLESALKASTDRFERADRGNLIDLTQVVEIDDKFSKAYFRNSSPEGKSKEATISKPGNYQRIKKRFLELNGDHSD